MQTIDKHAKTWFQNLGAYALPHANRTDVVFQPGTKYRIEADEWMLTQPTLVETDVDEDLDHLQLQPKAPGSPQFDKEADDKAAAEAVAKHVAKKNPELAKAKAKEDAAALKASQEEVAARQKQQDAEIERQAGKADPAKD